MLTLANLQLTKCGANTKHLIYLLLVSVLLFSNVIYAQTTELGDPKSWTVVDKNLLPASLMEMPSFNLSALQAEDQINDAIKDRPWRFGYEHKANIDVLKAAEVHTIPGVGTIYRLGVASPGAATINVVFSEFRLPVGGSLHLYNADRTHVVGAYTFANNHVSGQLGTDLITGDNIVVEYFLPAGSDDYTDLTISHVVHGYRSPFVHTQNTLKALNDSGDCNEDVNCPSGNGWDEQIRSVGMIVIGGGICSGAMVNNTSNDKTPYFLTARHCGSSYGSWAIRFNWESTVPVCSSNDVTPPVVTCTEFSETFIDCPRGISPNSPNGEFFPIFNLSMFRTAIGGSYVATLDLSGCVSDNCANEGFTSTLGRSYIETSVPGCSITIVNKILIRDAAGNQAADSITFRGIIMFDGPAPEITCPADSLIDCGVFPAVSTDGVAATSDCGTPTISVAENPVITGEPDVPGTTYSYTITATDGCGNMTTCERVFIVQDTTPPTVMANDTILYLDENGLA